MTFVRAILELSMDVKILVSFAAEALDYEDCVEWITSTQ